MNDFMASMKGASQRFAGAVADTGAKAMLKTDMAFLERDIKTRKQTFGVEIYEILESNSGDATASATKIQEAYDQCQKDIRQLESKVNSKRGEMESIERSSAAGGGAGSLLHSTK